MTPITSPSNPRLKDLRKLARARERARTGLFVAEGEDIVRAAHAAGREPVYGFRAPGVELEAPGFEELAPELLAGVSALGSGTRAIGVYEQRFAGAQGPLCVYLHGVGDPGNVGTVLRGALAFGASSVALGPGCADPHSPKAVRASMGAIFAVPIARVERADQLPGERIALVARAGVPLADLCGAHRADTAVTLLVGAERDGLPDELIAACEHVAHIPILGESLNAAMAATVALYETTRQRLTEEGLAGAGETLASGSHPRSGKPASGRLRHPLGRVPSA
jgi:TrmH family RNA methyltransferase